ncbi:MAG: hypothetical protein ACI87N_002388 [Flavobacteriales bacterium]|jgi:hypothetical protein
MSKIRNISFILLALISCGRSDKVTDKEEQEELQKQQKEQIISELTDKFSVDYSIDTLRYNYSIQFEDVLKSEYQMISRFRIHDIYNNDSISFIKIETGLFPTYYLNLSIPEKEQKKLLALDKSYYSRANAVLIVKLQEIKKIDLSLDSYPEDEEYCSLEFESSRSFLGKGQVIQVYVLN